MPVNMDNLRSAIREFDIKRILIRELGWDQCRIAPLPISIEAKTWTLNAVAQKRGLVVFQCDPGAEGRLPDFATRNQIERKVARTAFEHMVVYVDAAKSAQVWQWSKKEAGKPVQRREASFHTGAQGESLAQRLRGLAFTLDEEAELTQPEVVARTSEAMRAAKLTKRFFERFTKEHSVFLKFIEGITELADKEWYASLMLNRMMFVYFIQKKGFLDGDHDYLRNRLKMMQERAGRGRFHDFYRNFLLILFHSGLGQQPALRKPEIRELLGKIPYLNGGLFDQHVLEQTNKAIKIPDEAFERVFDFFEEYDWHLDARPGHTDHEINPDVLGYIFEKYINQKQMGAYYTKEDITGYICRNTIIPFLFDDAKKRCATAFKPDGGIWRLLRENPDRYVYPAVKHGLTLNYRTGAKLDQPTPLPSNIADGLTDVGKRGDWAKVASDDAGLPTETWREVVARRQRYEEVVSRLAKGEVTDINDLITLNLDIERFALDAIEQAESSDLVKAFWEAVTSVSVLDPTCGSGAFLFAALEVLKPIYDACLSGMSGFVEDIDRSGDDPRKKKLEWARSALEQAAKHPSEDYYIYKSIVIGNLYGVDLMREAVEICKLRLFLKLVAQVQTVDQIEPLPDIDFNIRPGNTLVGFTTVEQIKKVVEGEKNVSSRKMDFGGEYARLEEQIQETSRKYKLFREMQTKHDMDAAQFHSAKGKLRDSLDALRKELDTFLSSEYGILKGKPKDLAKWRESHQPMHWIAEFFAQVSKGGFDVIVGNPPYIARNKVEAAYALKGFIVRAATDIYAFVLERVSHLAAPSSRVGMIVPLSLAFSDDFASCRHVLFDAYGLNWFSSYGRIPSALFNFDVRVRNVIHLAVKAGTTKAAQTTRLHRWFEVERPHLMQIICYAAFHPVEWDFKVPKLSVQALLDAFAARRIAGKATVRDFVAERGAKQLLYFKKTAYNWLNFCPEQPPCYSSTKKLIPHTQFDQLPFRSESDRDAALLLLNSKCALLYWATVGDDFHVAKWMIEQLPVSPKEIFQAVRKPGQLAGQLWDCMKTAVSFKLNAGKRVGNFNVAKCRAVTDVVDEFLTPILGGTSYRDALELEYAKLVRTDFGEGDE